MNGIFFLLPLLIIPILIYADSEIIPTDKVIPIEPDQPRYFAKIENNTVTNVIVADPDFVLKYMEGTWIETWMEKDNSRKNYAGKGHSYNATLDAFVPKKPFNSWLLNTTNAQWDPPLKQPSSDYFWNEKIPNWVKK